MDILCCMETELMIIQITNIATIMVWVLIKTQVYVEQGSYKHMIKKFKDFLKTFQGWFSFFKDDKSALWQKNAYASFCHKRAKMDIKISKFKNNGLTTKLNIN